MKGPASRRVRICAACGQQIDPTDEVCPGCGLATREGDRPVTVNVPAPRRRSRKPHLIAAVVSLALWAGAWAWGFPFALAAMGFFFTLSGIGFALRWPMTMDRSEFQALERQRESMRKPDHPQDY
jgi:hypothetical protein